MIRKLIARTLLVLFGLVSTIALAWFFTVFAWYALELRGASMAAWTLAGAILASAPCIACNEIACKVIR